VKWKSSKGREGEARAHIKSLSLWTLLWSDILALKELKNHRRIGIFQH